MGRRHKIKDFSLKSKILSEYAQLLIFSVYSLTVAGDG